MTDVDPSRLRHDAVLLAGGRASRLGGIDKTALRVGGVALSDRALTAASAAARIVLVGLREDRPAPPGVVLTREDPPFAGPVAAIVAGLAAMPSTPEADAAPSPAWTLVLACDLVDPERAVSALLRAATAMGPATAVNPAPDGTIAVDEDGRRQPLLALYRTSALRRAIRDAGDPEGMSMRRLLAPLDLLEVPLPGALCADVDEPDDVSRLLDDTTLLD